MGRRKRISAVLFSSVFLFLFFVKVVPVFSSTDTEGTERTYYAQSLITPSLIPPKVPVPKGTEIEPLKRPRPEKKPIKEWKLEGPLFSNVLLVGMGETILGKYDVKDQGGLASTSHRLKGKFFTEGRFAFYFRGTLWDKYKITSSLDTKRDEDKLFRNLDPEKYYPTYGDDSSQIDETPTQGNFYLKAEWDKSYLMYGDYNTGLTGTELASYNRTLYGTKVDLETEAVTKFNTPKTKFIGYIAKAKQLAAHDELESTGGSLYYLRHKHIIEGSEKIYVLIRDKDTFLTKSFMALVPNQDYDIDYDDGRIILDRPLSMKISSIDDGLIENTVLSGDPVYLIADYEYEPDEGFLKNDNYGTRIIREFGDYIKVGGTYAKEVQGAVNYELTGGDILLRLNDKNSSNFSLEYALSKSNSIDNSITYNGGISFTEVVSQTSNERADSEAWKAKFNFDLKDALGLDFLESLDLNAYYQDIDPGFSSSSTISQEGAVKFGGEVSTKLSEDTELRISHDNQKTEYNSIGYLSGVTDNPIVETSLLSKDSKITTVGIEHQLTKKAKITQEWRRQDLDDATVAKMNQRQDLAATRFDYKFSDTFDGHLQQQYTLAGRSNNITTLGLSKSFTIKSDKPKTEEATENLDAVEVDDTTITLNTEFAMGNYGDGARFGISKEEPDGSISYMDYYIGDDLNGRRANVSTFGYRLKLSPTTEMYKEDRFSNNYSSWQRSNIVGLDYTPLEHSNLTCGISYERSYLDDTSGADFKDATVGKLTYVKKDKFKLSTKLELRNLKSDAQPVRQFATFNQLEYRLTPALRFMGKADWSTSEREDINYLNAHLEEYSAGLAYRPVNNDRLNLFTKFSYIVDDATDGQVDAQSIAESINHVYSAEGIYQLTPRIALTGKYALKYRKEMLTTDTEHVKSITDLWLGRISWRFYKDFTLHLEDRLLSQDLSDTKKNGVVIELTKPLGNLFVLGIGYNFTDFDDEVSGTASYLADYTAKGPYFRLVTKFFESRI